MDTPKRLFICSAQTCDMHGCRSGMWNASQAVTQLPGFLLGAHHNIFRKSDLASPTSKKMSQQKVGLYIYQMIGIDPL